MMRENTTTQLDDHIIPLISIIFWRLLLLLLLLLRMREEAKFPNYRIHLLLQTRRAVPPLPSLPMRPAKVSLPIQEKSNKHSGSYFWLVMFLTGTVILHYLIATTLCDS